MHALPLAVLSERQLTSRIVGTGRQPPPASSAVQSQPRSSCPCWEVLEGTGRLGPPWTGACSSRSMCVLLVTAACPRFGRGI